MSINDEIDIFGFLFYDEDGKRIIHEEKCLICGNPATGGVTTYKNKNGEKYTNFYCNNHPGGFNIKQKQEMNQAYNAKPSFTEWFDPNNNEHVRAYFTLQNTGMWPTNFIPISIYLEPNWQAIIAFKMANCWIDYKLSLPKEL